MNLLFVIDIKNGNQFYALLSFIAFLIGFIVLILEGRKRKFANIQWLLVIATSFLFFLVGAQVLKFSGEDWHRVFEFKKLTHDPGRSLLGGILLAIPGLLLTKYFLKLRYNLMDAFAFAVPLGLLIIRVGCHMAGCCYGKPTSVSWGVQYGADSYAFSQHLHDHLIPSTNYWSLVIHPVALYEAVGCMIILLLLNYSRRYMRESGNLFLASLGLYACLRFVTEFFRAQSFGFQSLPQLTIIQVVLLVVILFIVALILYREKKYSLPTPFVNTTTVPFRQVLCFFIFLLILFVFVLRWLTILEFVTFSIVMITVFAFMLWNIFKIITIPAMRLTTVTLMACSMIIMSQTLPEASKSDTTKLAYNIFSIGTLTGSNDFNINDVNYDCNGNITSKTVSHVLHNTYNINGAGYTRVEPKKNGEVLQYGIDAYWGSHNETDRNVLTDTITIKTIPIRGIHPYVQYDWQLIGAGVGFHIGTMSMLTVPTEYSYSVSPTAVKKINIFPSLYFRIGYVNRVFGEVKLGKQFPAPFPGVGFQTNIGVGFRKIRGGAIRIGTSSFAGLVIAPSLPLGRHFIFEPYVAFWPGLLPGNFNDQVDHTSSFVASASLRYKFGMNVKK